MRIDMDSLLTWFLQMLIHFFKKVSIDVETAGDGVQCTDKVFSHDPGYYSAIVVRLAFPPQAIKSCDR